jgi:VWFA-related protein
MSKFHVICLTLILGFPVLGWAGQSNPPTADTAQPPAQAPPKPVLTQRPPPRPDAADGLIQLDVQVTDPSGKPASGLQLSDFTLLDNGQPAKIHSFHAYDGVSAKPDPPVKVILLVDFVNMPFGQVSFLRQEIARFLRQDGGHLAQPVEIYLFTSEGVKFQPKPPTDGNALAAGLDKADDSRRRVSVVNGDMERLQLSLRWLAIIAHNEAMKPGRKLLIWAGPGWPMLLGLHYDTTTKGQRQLFDSIIALSTALRQAHIALYSIAQGMPDPGAFLYRDYLQGVKTPQKADAPNLSLKVLALHSGGRVLGPDNDLKAQIDSCFQDAGAYYTLSFDPPRTETPDQYHDLKVTVGKPGFTARTSSGYYNEP